MKKRADIEEYVSIMGHSMPRRELILLLSVVVFLFTLLGVGGYFYYKDWQENITLKKEKLIAIEQIEEEQEVVEKEALEPLEAFFEEYFEKTRMNEVETIRATGTYKVGELDMDLKFLARSPRLYKQSVSLNDHLIEFGFNGEEAWFDQSHEIVDARNEDLMKLNRDLAILESTVPTLAWDYDPLAEVVVFELMPDKVWNGRDCYVIKNSALLAGVPVYHYIDKEYFREVYRRASVQLSARRFKDVELFYDPPLEDSEHAIPAGIELLLDGRLFYKVTFDKVKVNQGIPTFMFEPDVRFQAE